MAETLALPKLFNDVVARFAAEGTNVPNVFGWSQRRQRGAQQNRICWEPGDPSGAAGALIGARQPGRNPRPIDTLEELFSVYIEGRDNSAPEDEKLQYIATMKLFMAWRRAVYLKPLDGEKRQLVTVRSTGWMVDRTVRRNGATLQVVCTVQLMIPDSAYTVAEDIEAKAAIELDSDGTPPGTSEEIDIPSL